LGQWFCHCGGERSRSRTYLLGQLLNQSFKSIEKNYVHSRDIMGSERSVKAAFFSLNNDGNGYMAMEVMKMQ
jgi:hypothetical protein